MTTAAWLWRILRRWHVDLLVIGAIRLVAGKDAAQRYIDQREENQS